MTTTKFTLRAPSIDYNRTIKLNVTLKKPKVQVNFRPHKNYKGEFGFDWIRIGDTRRDGDKDWYANLMGKYYLDSAYTSPNLDINDSTPSCFWKKDLKMYDEWLKSFKRKIDIKWKKDTGKKDFLYPVPIITLIPNDNKAILDVHLEINQKPKKIFLKPRRPDSGVIFNTKDITVKKGLLEGFLEVNCSTPLTKDLIVDVFADDLICGQFMILQNDANVVRNINVAFIRVQSDCDGYAKTVTGSPVSDGELTLKRLLKQALIKVNVKTLLKKLDVRGTYIPLINLEFSNTFRDKFCTKVAGIYTVNKNDGLLLGYLNTQFDEQFGDDYVRHNKIDYRVYFIGEIGAWNGFAMKGEKAGLYFPGHNKSTIPHELMHAMGLAHTFVNSEADSNAKFTYKIGQTTNVMDYSHKTMYGNMERNNLFYWQMKILNQKIK